MVIDYPQDTLAWKSDLQYMWGNEFLVAPNCSDNNNVSIWLPEGKWYDFWNDELLNGNRVIDYLAPTGKLPLFVKAGSIIPMVNYALSISAISNDSLIIHVYPGKDAAFELYEDDGVSENYRIKNEKRTTNIIFEQTPFLLKIESVIGNFYNASEQRVYQIIFHDILNPIYFEVNGKKIESFQTQQKPSAKDGISFWDANKKTLSLIIPRSSVTKTHIIKRIESCQ
jgi:alpha-glucosidase (family GH31 glycosyl hydrolase)